MGCDLVFKINGRLNGGLFDEQPSDLIVTIKDSELMSDADIAPYGDNFRNIHELSLRNIARELMKNNLELKQLVEYIQNLKNSGKSRSVDAKDIMKRGIMGNFKYSTLRAMYADNKKVHFPELQTPYNPDILLVDSLYFNGVDYRDIIFANTVNGNKVYVVADTPESVNKLNRHLAVRDSILNDFEGDEELEELMPEFRKAGKNFDTQQELLVDFLQSNSDYRDLVPRTYGLLSEIVRNIENEGRLGYKEVLDREFHNVLYFPKHSKIGYISIKDFVKFLSDNTPDLVQDLTRQELKDPEVLTELFNKLNDKFTEFSGKLVEIADNQLVIRAKFPTVEDIYGLTYSSIKEQVRFTGEVYRGFHIYEWNDGSKTRYLYNQGAITPTSKAEAADSIEEIYRRVDIAYRNKLSFVKGFDAGFRTIPAYERVNSVFVRRFYMPGSVVKVLDIELNKDTEFNADERLILDNPKATLADFYKLFENQLTESQFGLLKNIVDSIETAGIFLYLINDRTGSDVSSRNLKENTVFNDIIQEIMEAKEKNKYKMYFIQDCHGKGKQYYADIIPINGDVEMNEHFQRPEPIIGLINEVVDAFNDRFHIGATVLNQEEIIEQFPHIPANTKAFISDGKVYINGSIATSEDVVHEYTHLILGVLKATNFDMYTALLEKVFNSKDATYFVNSVTKRYENEKLAHTDLQEEVFVAAFADFLAGKRSSQMLGRVKEEVDKKMKSIFNLATEEDFNTIYKGRMRDMFQIFSKDIGKVANDLDFSKGRVYRQASKWISDQMKDEKIIEECK